MNGETFKITPVKAADDNEQTYICQYTTPPLPTKNGKRDTLNVQIEVSG